MNITESDITRFWSKVEKRGANECWEWTGARTGHNYGSMKLNGRMVGSHRLALIVSGVELSDDLQACHRCDNPPCCNPAHLYAGTYYENHADKARRGRQRTGDAHHARAHPEIIPRGERHGMAKLNDEAVREIRKSHQEGENYLQISTRLNFHPTTIGLVVRKKTWKHVK